MGLAARLYLPGGRMVRSPRGLHAPGVFFGA